MDRSRVAIIVPALNEEATIADVVLKSKKFGTLIVVDDGSLDRTKEFAINAGAHVLRNSKLHGYENAINCGFSYAISNNYEYIITIDADGQHDSEMINKFIEALEMGADLVIGERESFQRFSEALFSLYSTIRWKIRDPLSGMKAYKAEIFREYGTFCTYNSIGTELLFFAARNEKKIYKIPISIKQRKDRSRFGGLFKSNYRIIRAIVLDFIINLIRKSGYEKNIN